jgi:LacI family transcriptional regulator
MRIDVRQHPAEFAGTVEDWLVQDSLPTAIITSDFFMSLAVANRLNAIGVAVPSDVSIVCFDNPPAAAHVAPAMTCIAQDVPGLGHVAVETLIRRIRREPVGSGNVVPTTLVVRDSTSPPMSQPQ